MTSPLTLRGDRLMMVAAAVLPSLPFGGASPTPNFLNQWLAAISWLLVGLLTGAPRTASGPVRGPIAALGLTAAAVVASCLVTSLPSGIALLHLGLIGAAVCCLMAGAQAGRLHPTMALADFCVAWTMAGALNAVIALVQVFGPELSSSWIAMSSAPGRAVGNLRQPNHLSSLLLWSVIGTVGLVELRVLSRSRALPLLALLVFAVVLTASRTGFVGALLCGAWGLAGRRRHHRTWLLLVAVPVVYALGWVGMAIWAEAGHQAFGGVTRLHESDLSASRFAIWRDTMLLIAAQPWAGVGFGNFNFAWSLTALPQRPRAFFDHAHDLPLQVWVEQGLLLGSAVVVLLVASLWWAVQRAWRVETTVAPRIAALVVLMISLHSLLEYPLWYAYFLLPAAWAWGFALADREEAVRPVRREPWMALTSAAILVAASMWTWQQYGLVRAIFDPPPNAAPLADRIAAGRKTLLFAHHADYAAATTAEHPSEVMDAFDRATHHLLDTRLMIAWSKAFAERGEMDKARHIAQRLREFRNPGSKEFFAPCDGPPPLPEPLPYQCTPPSRLLDWREFLPPNAR